MKTTVSIGITVNLGNYESLRLDMSQELDNASREMMNGALLDLRDDLIAQIEPLGSKAQSAVNVLRNIGNPYIAATETKRDNGAQS